MQHADKLRQFKVSGRIGVLAGGFSAEREVSLRTGAAVLKALTQKGYDAVMIDAGRDLCNALMRERVGLAFVALHGGVGENGAVQGLLEVVGIPYTGSGVLASALAMDKEASKKVFLYHGIPVTPFRVLRESDVAGLRDLPPQEIVDALAIPFPMPWVIKPSAEGSSVGVNIVKQAADLPGALQQAFSFGPTLLIESYIKGKEIQIGILGERVLGGVEVRPSHEYYSYEAKYTPGLTEYILPPDVSEQDYATLKDLAHGAHRALGCSGATRVDLILDESHNVYVLEVNTIPGMTETSLLPKIARLSGMDFPELVEEIVAIAIA